MDKRTIALSLLWQVILLRVFLHHPPGVIFWHQRPHGSRSALDPLPGNAIGIAVEEHGNDLFGQPAVEIRAVHAVLFLNAVRVGIGSDREAVGAVITLSPPAVQDAEVQAPVTARLLAARPGSFEGATGIV